MTRFFTTSALLLAFTLSAFAAEPPPPEQLPPPRESVPPAVLPPPTVVGPVVVVPPSMIEPANPFGLPPVVYTRRSDYEVWQNVAVDRYGRFRPVVVMSPYGDYYRYNGQPYPWRQLNQKNIMGYVVQPAIISPTPPVPAR